MGDGFLAEADARDDGTPGADMLIHVSDSSLVPSLKQYLARCDCRSHERSETSLDVTVPTERVDATLARLQLDGYLRTWCSLHAGVSATVVNGARDDAG
jgi:hypothetical protein